MTDALASARAEFEALCNQKAAAMVVIRPALDALARFAGASDGQLRLSRGAIESELSDLVWHMQSAIEDRIADAERAIEEADAT